MRLLLLLALITPGAAYAQCASVLDNCSFSESYQYWEEQRRLQDIEAQLERQRMEERSNALDAIGQGESLYYSPYSDSWQRY